MTSDTAARQLHEGRRAGIAMFAAIAIGMAAANSPLSGIYAFVHHFPIRLGNAPFILQGPLIDWINQGLLVIFFFHIGLHTKREMTAGALSKPGGAALPAIAALGGMAMPALIYLAFSAGDSEALGGWAIPIATDVVLVLGLLSVFGAAVSPGLLAFVVAVAIFDDLGAVTVIALFYGEVQTGWSLLAIAAGLGGLGTLNRLGSAASVPYLLAGGMLWAGLVGSGLEGAVAGAVVGLSLPRSALQRRSGIRAERRIAPISLFFVVPIFAFFNSGVTLGGGGGNWLTDPVAQGIMAALFVGKPLGIMLGTLCALRTGIGVLPAQISLRDVASAALFSGVGFTVSLFIATAAFDDPARTDAAKIAVLIGSGLSALLASVALVVSSRRVG